MTSELSQIVKLSELGSAVETIMVDADADQRKSLAERFDLPAIDHLSASGNLEKNGQQISFSGTIKASLQQSCSISGDAFPVSVEEHFEIMFLPKPDDPDGEVEIELSADDCDIVEYQGNQIDIGEAVAQTLYLALDPYPRGPTADTVAEKQGLKNEDEASPFGALAALKDKLG